MPLFAPENTQRVESQKRAPMFVVIGNPPYNVGQVNENDNNKNRKYPTMDKRVAETYARTPRRPTRTNFRTRMSKAFRWAADRIGEEGYCRLCDQQQFSRRLSRLMGCGSICRDDFDAIYVLDLGGNVRVRIPSSPARPHVFGIRVGVSINLLSRQRAAGSHSPAFTIYRPRR